VTLQNFINLLALLLLASIMDVPLLNRTVPIVYDGSTEHEGGTTMTAKPPAPLSKGQMLVLIINNATIRPCSSYLGLFQAYLLDSLGFSMLDISYIESALQIGSISAFLFPVFIAKFDELSTRMFGLRMTERGLLSYLHALCGVTIASYMVFGGLGYYIATRFLFGLSRRLYSSYKNSMVARHSKEEDWLLNYAVLKISEPLTMAYLIGFGVLLNHSSYALCMSFLSAPLILSSLLLYWFMPTDSINAAAADGESSSIWDLLTVLNDFDRALKSVIGFCGGLKISMFSLILSSWFSDWFHVNLSAYYMVLAVQIVAEFGGIFLTILYGKYIQKASAILLYAFSKFIGVVCFGLIWAAILFPDAVAISYESALAITGFMYLSSMLRSASGGTINMQLADVPRQRALFSSFKFSCITCGSLVGILMAAHLYQHSGMRSVAMFGTLICSMSCTLCIVLWWRLKNRSFDAQN